MLNVVLAQYSELVWSAEELGFLLTPVSARCSSKGVQTLGHHSSGPQGSTSHWVASWGSKASKFGRLQAGKRIPSELKNCHLRSSLVVSMVQLCRRLYRVIEDSLLLQYKTELEVEGFDDVHRDRGEDAPPGSLQVLLEE